MKRPPGPEDDEAYRCLDLDRLKIGELKDEMTECTANIRESKRVSSQSWWAFRYDECLKRIHRLRKG